MRGYSWVCFEKMQTMLGRECGRRRVLQSVWNETVASHIRTLSAKGPGIEGMVPAIRMLVRVPEDVS